jgi:hypothetical protein
VAREAHRLVLGEHQDFANAAVEAVRQREVDNPVDAAERHGRLGAIAGEGFKARSFAAGQNHRQDVFHARACSVVRDWVKRKADSTANRLRT